MHDMTDDYEMSPSGISSFSYWQGKSETKQEKEIPPGRYVEGTIVHRKQKFLSHVRAYIKSSDERQA